MLKHVRFIAVLLTAGLVAALPFTAFADGSAVSESVTPLLSAQELHGLLDHSDIRVLDIRSPHDYAAGHIPGAVNTPYAAYRGPADNPGKLRSAAELTELLRAAGIDENTHVVVAHAGSDQTDFGAAARVYWTLKAGGLSALSILDGGTLGWQATDHDLATETPAINPSDFSYRYDQALIADTQELADTVASEQAPLLLDARPASFFNGEQRVDAAARYGTLPGAQVLAFSSFFEGESTTLKSADELRTIAEQANAADAPIVSFCNTGHWAATNWFVLSELVGNQQVSLYPESVVGWSKTDLPMENQPSRLTALVQDAKRALNK